MTHESVLPSRHRHRHGLRLCGLFSFAQDKKSHVACELEFSTRLRRKLSTGVIQEVFEGRLLSQDTQIDHIKHVDIANKHYRMQRI